MQAWFHALAAADPDVERWRLVDVRGIDQALDCLDDDLRTLMETQLLQGRSYEAIGALLGLPTGTVGTRLMRARSIVRRAIEAAEQDGEAARSA